jgi:outer membrane receptor protein involved in Fe transport
MLLSSLTTDPPLRQGSYVVLNLSTAWRLNPRFDVSGSITNAFDREYSDSSANNPQNLSLSQPRTFTAGFRARF